MGTNNLSNKMSTPNKLFIREILLSTGEFTKEAVIYSDGREYYDSAPSGSTIGLKETQSQKTNIKYLKYLNYKKDLLSLNQVDFDKELNKKNDSQTSTAFSLAYLKFLAHKDGFTEKELFKYVSLIYKRNISSPKIICNILNGGKHGYNALAFCEFMIIPKGVNIRQNIKIISEVYSDLRYIIKKELGERSLILGREGGFSPSISNVEEAIALVDRAIQKHNSGLCFIAIDVAANNFVEKKSLRNFTYNVNNKDYSTDELIKYYSYLIKKYPSIKYLEDPLHENDINGWKNLFMKFDKKILIVADDLTVSKLVYLKKYKKCFNACILKVNQSGNLTEFMKAYNYCVANNIKTIISQRSGETDSNIISHLAVGLGGDYIKAGAPVRERIIKYNELLRIV